ncbi:MAG: zinc ribbon domain-containing protein [Candidatus Hadarchaeales archaeon]
MRVLYCPGCGEKLPRDAKFCPSCGESVRAKAPEMVAVEKPKAKSPAIAAVLNFFFPGIGFAYIGTPLLITLGIIIFLLDVLITIPTLGFWFTPEGMVMNIVLGLLFAVLGAYVTHYMNEKWKRGE